MIKMRIEEGWHTYWKNPGEAGLALSIETKMPEGWTLGEIQFPVPKRFMTGELSGFGYEGEVAFPVTITPPADFEGKIPSLTATSKWLTCSDEKCVPGEAAMTLSSSADKAAVNAAYESLPHPIPGAKLAILSAEEFLQLTLTLPADSEIDPSKFDVLPATPDVIAPAAKPSFKANPTTPRTWIATAPKSEYLSSTPETVSILLKDADGTSYEISSKQ